MTATLPVVGAQISLLDIDRHRDWLFEKDRDLELPEFCLVDVLKSPGHFIDIAKDKLKGFKGRLGIHGPFTGFELSSRDADVREVVQRRLDQGVEVCARLGATQMVVYSPYDAWDRGNLDNAANARERRIEAVRTTLAPALKRAEAMGVVLVLENIKDPDPAERRRLVEAIGSRSLRLSVDTGHAHWAHRTLGAVPADRFITDAGVLLGHVHLQDADGHADRHWAIGQGDILWPGVFAEIAATKSQPHLILELNDTGGIPASMAYLEAAGLAQ